MDADTIGKKSDAEGPDIELDIKQAGSESKGRSLSGKLQVASTGLDGWNLRVICSVAACFVIASTFWSFRGSAVETIVHPQEVPASDPRHRQDPREVPAIDPGQKRYGGPLLGPDQLWVMEDVVSIGSVKLGLPGFAALTLSSTSLFEVMPRILADGNVGKLPLLPYSAMLAASIMWCTYGFLAESPVIWCPNAFGLVLSSLYCAIFLKFCPPCADWLPLQRKHHIAFVVGIASVCAALPALLPPSLTMQLLGTLGAVVTVVMFAGPLAAIRTVLADRSTASLPFGFTCAVAVNTTLWTYFGWYMAGDPFVYVPNGLGLLIACVQLSLFGRFGFAK